MWGAAPQPRNAPFAKAAWSRPRILTPGPRGSRQALAGPLRGPGGPSGALPHTGVYSWPPQYPGGALFKTILAPSSLLDLETLELTPRRRLESPKLLPPPRSSPLPRSALARGPLCASPGGPNAKGDTPHRG